MSDHACAKNKNFAPQTAFFLSVLAYPGFGSVPPEFSEKPTRAVWPKAHVEGAKKSRDEVSLNLTLNR